MDCSLKLSGRTPASVASCSAGILPARPQANGAGGSIRTQRRQAEGSSIEKPLSLLTLRFFRSAKKVSGRWGDRPLWRWGWREPWSSPVGPFPITVAILPLEAFRVDSPLGSFLPILRAIFRVPALWYWRTPTSLLSSASPLRLCGRGPWPCRPASCRHLPSRPHTHHVAEAVAQPGRFHSPQPSAAAQNRVPAARSGPRRLPKVSSQSPRLLASRPH